jgi:hypothetical protein
MQYNKLLKQLGIYFTVLALLFLIVNLPSHLHTQTVQQQQANVASNEISKQKITAYAIFQNNFLVALLTLVPFAGWSWIGAVLWKTGLVIASYNQPYWALTNAFVWIELAIYSFVVLQSVNITLLLRHRKTMQIKLPIIKIVLATVSVAMLTLLISAVLEYMIIMRTVYI